MTIEKKQRYALLSIIFVVSALVIFRPGNTVSPTCHDMVDAWERGAPGSSAQMQEFIDTRGKQMKRAFKLYMSEK